MAVLTAGLVGRVQEVLDRDRGVSQSGFGPRQARGSLMRQLGMLSSSAGRVRP